MSEAARERQTTATSNDTGWDYHDWIPATVNWSEVDPPFWKIENDQDWACRSMDKGHGQCSLPGLPEFDAPSCKGDKLFQPVFEIGLCLSCNASELQAFPGYICENGSLTRCPAGSYCPVGVENRTPSVYPCPSGSICFAGFTEPLPCATPWVFCPEGATMIWPGLGTLVAFLALCIFVPCWSLIVRRIHRRGRKAVAAAEERLRELGDVHNSHLADAKLFCPQPVDIEFSGLGLTLKMNGRQVLSDVTGRFPPASFVALMGPSGSGKTTFMNTLLGLADYGTAEGIVRVNGRKSKSASCLPRNVIGFVPQDDIMHANLTVHDNLLYNAWLRLPRSVTAKQKYDHVSEVIKALGLQEHQHVLVGDPLKRGISGGQKKRVNIGMELAAMPAVLFMDEPTSGLDGSVSLQLTRTLCNLQKTGLTIVCVIHQPRFAVFREFSHLLLLAPGGHAVFCGRAKLVEDYLTCLGFRMQPGENVADWIIDVASGYNPDDLNNADDVVAASPDNVLRLVSSWSHVSSDPQAAAKWCNGDPLAASGLPPVHGREVPALVWQVSALIARCWQQFSIAEFVGIMTLMLFSGTLIGILEFRYFTFSYAYLVTALVLPRVLFFIMAAANSQALFGAETLQYKREFSAGISCFAYWLAKNIYYLFFNFMIPIGFAAPLYWLSPNLMPFWEFVSVYILCSWYWSGFGQLVSVLIPNQAMCLLLLVFWPAMESLVDGSIFSVPWIVSSCTAGKWFRMRLALLEILSLPPNTRKFPEILAYLYKSDLQNLEESCAGAAYALLLLGCIWRLLTLLALLNTKWRLASSCRSALVGRCTSLLPCWWGQESCCLGALLRRSAKMTDPDSDEDSSEDETSSSE
eukprot:TRINITY_DN90561_c0_g1_i1.p1 TRINITY_DN90561_c0_g1~~TRINITY_DN90561_c0_g1_i1.p1  ORF type:complete len:860 (+),score=134.16 TRINITY_DN90561_c0_g1_i1:137-2716(+)